MKRYFHDISIAIEALLANKLKSILTALGIIFGVAAVISMLAIGNGAQQEILEQIKLVGVNNIVISPILKSNLNENENEEESESKKFSKGLTLKDVNAIKEILPNINIVSPEIAIESFIAREGKRTSAKMIGVTSEYFDIYNIELEEGKVFNDYQLEHGLPVCIIGSKTQKRFFNNINPVGQYIKCGHVWLKIIGVLKNQNFSNKLTSELGINVSNNKIFIPIRTVLMQYKNRALISSKLSSTSMFFIEGGSIISSSNGTDEGNYNQLDKIVVQVKETEQINNTVEILSRMLLRRHSEVPDFEINVPELLLKQQQKTKDIFNIVLGAIASISLIVGGIGIMNIMLASVMERIKEIGTRQALGASKKDIVVQFLAESTMISLTGGLIGIILGYVFTELIKQFADILTIISPFSVIIAFGVSASIGVIFGYMPAKRAAQKDPVESLRHE
ncbi:MAG: FtsX-like permease family protein [Bacteroidetes bacterium]|jgi:putative ABC transport system permease protein|nr:FtsX-like permease family protein [Bacteroidota bacterium]MBT6686552.1 FtsX-like permease family protein [Bacteroidota bacterium]MBT7142915.1 FtsX-like permease family protein [Bacteroidota bacterium]MBT7490636.1 FtsX-like permease family protein [Bacteroidota bacterium]